MICAEVSHTSFDVIVASIEQRNGYPITHFQRDIYEALYFTRDNLQIEAVAGSGKTSVLEDGTYFLPPNHKKLLLAFNKHIAIELEGRDLAFNSSARTVNSIGMGLCYKLCKHLTLDEDKITNAFFYHIKWNTLSKKQKPRYTGMIEPMKRVCSVMKLNGYGSRKKPLILPFPSFDEMIGIADDVGVDLPEKKDQLKEFYTILEEVYTLSLNTTNIIDFDDQVLLPIAYEVEFPSYNDVLIDESQDLAPINIEIVKRLSRNGRVVFVGDSHQAIYAFRGADANAMATVRDDFNTKELPLSVCWRCPKSHIREVQKIIPHIEYAPDAIEGERETITEEEYYDLLSPDDFVICRVTAPLIKDALSLLRDDKRVEVLGKEIGVGLTQLCTKISKATNINAMYPDDPLSAIVEYGERAVKALQTQNRNIKAALLEDRIDTLAIIAASETNYKDIKSKIDLLFSDKHGPRITFATIHKAKGLQYRRVFMLRPDKLPHPMARSVSAQEQEINLRIIAYTRATESFFIVKPTNEKKSRKS